MIQIGKRASPKGLDLYRTRSSTRVERHVCECPGRDPIWIHDKLGRVVIGFVAS